MLDKSQCKLEYWGSVGLHGLKGDCKAYRNDFSSISAAPSKWWKWKLVEMEAGLGKREMAEGKCQRAENPIVTMTKVKNTLWLTIKLYNYECGPTDRPKIQKHIRGEMEMENTCDMRRCGSGGVSRQSSLRKAIN